MTLNEIIDPRTRQPIPVEQLARESGLPRYTLLYRWGMGIRGMSLLAPGNTTFDLEREHRISLGLFLVSPAGVLSTHRLRDYARARRQLEERAA